MADKRKVVIVKNNKYDIDDAIKSKEYDGWIFSEVTVKDGEAYISFTKPE